MPFWVLLLISSVQCIQTPSFTQSALTRTLVGLENVDGYVGAIGDFNGDRHSDLAIVNTAQTAVSLYIWKDDAFLKLENAVITSSWTIENVVMNDFNRDGKLDLMLVSKRNSTSYSMIISFGNGLDGFSKTLELVDSSVQPTLVDLYGTLSPQILGLSNNQPFLLGNITFDAFSMNSNLSNLFSNEICTLANPNSNAFLDLNGDCLADLVLVCDRKPFKTLQIWVNDPISGMSLYQEYQLPTGAGQISFADFDGDGNIDLMFPVCNKNCFLQLVYNYGIPLCQDDSSVKCRSFDSLCVKDDSFYFDFTNKTGGNLIYQLDSLVGGSTKIILNEGSFVNGIDIPIRVADYDNDRYPDLLFLTVKDNIQYLNLLHSVPCTIESCGKNGLDRNQRYFELISTGVDALKASAQETVIGATFFDVFDDGTFDLLVFKKTPNGKRIDVLLNNIYKDSFYLRVMASNGLCYKRCSDQEPSSAPFSSNQIGASFRFIITDTRGLKKIASFAQYPQSGHLSLHSGHCLIGIGRTNNYIQDLVVGMPLHQEIYTAEYPGIIPNSDLVIVPYQPNGLKSTDTWSVELFINPASYSANVFWTFALTIALLTITVAVLSWLEKRQDAIEKKNAIQNISYEVL